VERVLFLAYVARDVQTSMDVRFREKFPHLTPKWNPGHEVYNVPFFAERAAVREIVATEQNHT
jgi:hypothetical protein